MQTLADSYFLDKSNTYGHHNYIPVYESLFSPIKDSVKCLYEIGIGCVEKGDMIHMVSHGYKTGNSLRMWRDYFPNAEIHGLDINPEAMITTEERIITHICDQSNSEQVIHSITSTNLPIDIVIDDGSHNSAHQAASFEYIHPFLKSGAIYCIEDIWPGSIPLFQNFNIFSEKIRSIINTEYEFKFFDQRTHPNDNSVVCVFIKK
jgi:8-demethyl-8-alpha-L-rhamnosyltetracenomycin-C 2'-O-methyltransferase